jgi:cell division protein FtsQ
VKRLWHTPGLLNALANALILLSLLGLLCAAGWWLAQRPGLALRVVRIDAAPGTELRHVSAVLLDQSVRQRLRGNFFTVDLDAVRAGFEQVPWVRRAMVRRVWPDRLEVAIEEHRPLATWGENQLMNTFGELYTANAAEAEEDGPLPHFSGPPGSEQRMLGRYEELRRWLAPLGVTPRSVLLSPRLAWWVQLDDGTRLVLGREQGVPLEERVARWVEAYPRVRGRLGERAQVIDLRYPNGFAARAAGAEPPPADHAPPPAPAGDSNQQDSRPALSESGGPTRLAALQPTGAPRARGADRTDQRTD